MPGLPPKIEVLRDHGKTTTMLVEALAGDTIQDIIITARKEFVAKALTTMARTMREAWTRGLRHQTVPSNYTGQLEKRLPDIIKVHPEFERPTQAIGDAVLPSLAGSIQAARERERQLEAPFSVFIHGDCNSNNIIYNRKLDRIHYIDLHRSTDGDFCQDVSVFLVSNFRIPIFDNAYRRCVDRVSVNFLAFARDFAHDNGDTTFDARLCLGLGRSLITSTRFELHRRFARLMFQRGLYLLQLIARHDAPYDSFSLPEEAILYK